MNTASASRSYTITPAHAPEAQHLASCASSDADLRSAAVDARSGSSLGSDFLRAHANGESLRNNGGTAAVSAGESPFVGAVGSQGDAWGAPRRPSLRERFGRSSGTRTAVHTSAGSRLQSSNGGSCEGSQKTGSGAGMHAHSPHGGEGSESAEYALGAAVGASDDQFESGVLLRQHTEPAEALTAAARHTLHTEQPGVGTVGHNSLSGGGSSRSGGSQYPHAAHYGSNGLHSSDGCVRSEHVHEPSWEPDGWSGGSGRVTGTELSVSGTSTLWLCISTL